MTEVVALVLEQLADIAVVQKMQAELAASGLAEVTVDAHGELIRPASLTSTRRA
jgi:ligand-binding sensor protein